jgi:hypothetical protein
MNYKSLIRTALLEIKFLLSFTGQLQPCYEIQNAREFLTLMSEPILSRHINNLDKCFK